MKERRRNGREETRSSTCDKIVRERDGYVILRGHTARELKSRTLGVFPTDWLQRRQLEGQVHHCRHSPLERRDIAPIIRNQILVHTRKHVFEPLRGSDVENGREANPKEGRTANRFLVLVRSQGETPDGRLEEKRNGIFRRLLRVIPRIRSNAATDQKATAETVLVKDSLTHFRTQQETLLHQASQPVAQRFVVCASRSSSQTSWRFVSSDDSFGRKGSCRSRPDE